MNPLAESDLYRLLCLVRTFFPNFRPFNIRVSSHGGLASLSQDVGMGSEWSHPLRFPLLIVFRNLLFPFGFAMGNKICNVLGASAVRRVQGDILKTFKYLFNCFNYLVRLN